MQMNFPSPSPLKYDERYSKEISKGFLKRKIDACEGVGNLI